MKFLTLRMTALGMALIGVVVAIIFFNPQKTSAKSDQECLEQIQTILLSSNRPQIVQDISRLLKGGRLGLSFEDTILEESGGHAATSYADSAYGGVSVDIVFDRQSFCGETRIENRFLINGVWHEYQHAIDLLSGRYPHLKSGLNLSDPQTVRQLGRERFLSEVRAYMSVCYTEYQNPAEVEACFSLVDETRRMLAEALASDHMSKSFGEAYSHGVMEAAKEEHGRPFDSSGTVYQY